MGNDKVMMYVTVRIEPTLQYITIKDELNLLFTLNIPFSTVVAHY